MAIDSKAVSSWVRQARYRAKKHDIYSDLEISDVQEIIATTMGLCSYCNSEADTLDCPFPLRNGGPNTPANVVPCCKSCKTTKSYNDIVWMFTNGHITQATYLALIEGLCQRRGGDIIKDHVRRATGIVGNTGS
jgi:hypothetical protein